jgi:integrase
MSRTRMSAWTQDEFVNLLAVAKQHNERHYVMFLIMGLHGLRASEVINLTTENFCDNFLTVKRLKGSKATVQPLLTNSNPLLNEKEVVNTLLAETPAGGFLFPSDWFNGDGKTPLTRHGLGFLSRKYGTLAGIPKHRQHPHSGKHYTGRTLANAGMPIEELKLWLGHASVQSTIQYLQCSDDSVAASAQKLFDDI